MEEGITHCRNGDTDLNNWFKTYCGLAGNFHVGIVLCGFTIKTWSNDRSPVMGIEVLFMSRQFPTCIDCCEGIKTDKNRIYTPEKKK